MLKIERQQHILDWLSREGRVLASQLSKTLEVSEDTVRRDLQELDQEGKVRRVHGGALERSARSASFTERQRFGSEAKAEIGRCAARLIHPGQTVLFDGGTTTWRIPQFLPPEIRLKAITNSLPLALELCSRPNIEITLIGGGVLQASQTVVGAEAVEQIRQLRADLLFLGTCALHRKQGITAPYREEAAVKRAMVASASRVAAVATADKLNTVAAHLVAEADVLDYLIVDGAADGEVLRKYRKLGIEVEVAGASSDERSRGS